jgi:hypothetical protein
MGLVWYKKHFVWFEFSALRLIDPKSDRFIWRYNEDIYLYTVLYNLFRIFALDIKYSLLSISNSFNIYYLGSWYQFKLLSIFYNIDARSLVYLEA